MGRGEISAMFVISGMFMKDNGVVIVQELFELTALGWKPRGVL